MARLNKDISQSLLLFLTGHPNSSSKTIHDEFAGEISYASTKRLIQKLTDDGFIVSSGKGRGVKYSTTAKYELLYPIDPDAYFEKEIDDRIIKNRFNEELISVQLNNIEIFTNAELSYLNILQKQYHEKVLRLSKAEYDKELERLAIDLSWKSSQIEGNTYSLLETERLLKEKLTASGKTKDEAVMLLNHKEALDFIIEHPDYVSPLSVQCIEDIHSILIKELNIERNLRRHSVGITGTNYKPLDNEYHIREALRDTCELINKTDNVFTKVLLCLVLISYIQPFVDGNKRTARIISNALLINSHYCPISFRTVDSLDYKKAMLIFYERNNISAFKQIFIEQFRFAVETYF